MSKQTTFATTDAGHKFLELYAEPVVTNTYLKVAILVLSVVALALLALLYRAQTAALRLKPLVISVSDIGRGQVVNYSDFSKVPVERVSKYYLARWAELYYGRNHATLAARLRRVPEFLLERIAVRNPGARHQSQDA